MQRRVKPLERLTVRLAAAGALLFCLIACGSDGSGPDDGNHPPTDTLTLRKAAAARGFYIGAAADRLFRNDAEGTAFKTVLAREFNMLTPENDMKHDRLQPARGAFSFTRADELVSFAQANNMKVRGHVLVWHRQNASWLANGTWPRDTAIALMLDHINAVVDHFKGRIMAWDVVNEAVDDNGVLRVNESIWSKSIGPDYIERAFRAARAADPQALLFYNDYNIEGLNAKSDSVYALLSRLRSAGVPVHGVGFQGHFQAGGLPTNSSMSNNIARFAALGLKIHFTELDIRVQVPASSASLQTQAANYSDVVAVCLGSSACTAIVTWGVTDKDSWVPNTFSGWGDALLFDAQYSPKQPYYLVRNLLSGN